MPLMKSLEIIVYIFIFYLILNLIVSTIALWKIFTKEKIPAYYSIIPFYNVYKYFQLCRLPFWPIFIPGINIICLFCSCYIITKKYGCKKWQSILAIFFPFVLLPYIAFSNKNNIDRLVDNMYVKSIKDIDNLELKLKNDKYSDIDLSNSEVISKPIVETEKSFVDNIEANILNDEYVYDDVETIDIKNENASSNLELADNGFIEIDEEITIDNLSLENVDKIEKKITVENSVERKIETNIQEYQDFSHSDEAVAFGGQRKIEDANYVKAKNEELKCSRCGSTLVGSNGFCPGCGAKL